MNNVNTPKKLRLSASRIKELDNCSWMFYVNNVLRVPQTPHPKTLVGTIVHSVFEVLKNPRHYHHFVEITSEPNPSIHKSKAIMRMIQSACKRLGVSYETFQAEFNGLIQVGLKYDFFHKGALQVLPPEYEFVLHLEPLELKGLIDDCAEFENEVLIRDFKSQSRQFTDEQLRDNIQAGIYQLAARKRFNKPARVEFVLLRFPENPIQTVPPYSEKQLRGLESYLSKMGEVFKSFTEKEAQSDFAYNHDDKKWLCGFARSPGQKKKDGTPMWYCPYKFPVKYFALIDSISGQIISTGFDKQKLEAKANFDSQVVEKQYDGCPVFAKFNKGVNNNNDPTFI